MQINLSDRVKQLKSKVLEVQKLPLFSRAEPATHCMVHLTTLLTETAERIEAIEAANAGQ